FKRVVIVPVVVRQVLVMPDDFTGIRVQRQGGVGVEQRSITRAAQRLGQRRGNARTPIGQVQLGVVGAGHPRGSVEARFQRQVAPAVATFFTRTRDGVTAPDFFARIHVIGGNEATARQGRARRAERANKNLVA